MIILLYSILYLLIALLLFLFSPRFSILRDFFIGNNLDGSETSKLEEIVMCLVWGLTPIYFLLYIIFTSILSLFCIIILGLLILTDKLFEWRDKINSK